MTWMNGPWDRLSHYVISILVDTSPRIVPERCVLYFRFRESDQLPGNVRQKLEALPAVMLKLETSQASGKGQ